MKYTDEDGDFCQSPLVDLQKLTFNESTGVALEFFENFKQECLVFSKMEGRADCLDFPTMVKALIACIDSELRKLKAKTKSPATLIGQDSERLINDLMNEAKGCPAMCFFCNRKCELKPHNEEVEHNCAKKGHQMRVFGGGFLIGPSGKYPSLKVCDEIDANKVIMVERAGQMEK